jgi:hypothetical protein
MKVVRKVVTLYYIGPKKHITVYFILVCSYVIELPVLTKGNWLFSKRYIHEAQLGLYT